MNLKKLFSASAYENFKKPMRTYTNFNKKHFQVFNSMKTVSSISCDLFWILDCQFRKSPILSTSTYPAHKFKGSYILTIQHHVLQLSMKTHIVWCRVGTTYWISCTCMYSCIQSVPKVGEFFIEKFWMNYIVWYILVSLREINCKKFQLSTTHCDKVQDNKLHFSTFE